jgi:osmotically-inducible protein OsmY
MKSTYSLPLILAAGSMLLTTASLRASDADQAVTHEIFDLLVSNNSLAPDGAKFQTVDGVVTITGTTRSLDHQAQLDNVIAKLPGVQSVVDNRPVTTTEANEPASVAKSQKVDDNSIKYQLKSALMFHNLTGNTITQIDVKNGTVMITGVAKSEAEKSRTTQLAAGITGVTGVVNNMTVVVAPVASN